MNKQTLHRINESLRGHCNRLPVTYIRATDWNIKLTKILFDLVGIVRETSSRAKAKIIAGVSEPWTKTQKVTKWLALKEVRRE